MIWAFPLLIIIVAFLWAYLSSNLIMQIPRFPIEAGPAAFGLEFEPFTVVTDDSVRIEGWFVPAKKPSTTTLFALHGWGANRSDVLAHTAFLGEKYNLVYFDFRNHGASGNALNSLTCSEISDFMTVARHVRKNHADKAKQMAVFGFSMGAAVAIAGAAKMPDIKAVVAESPFASFNETVVRFARHFYGIPRFIIPLTLWAVRLRLGFDPEDCAPLYHVDKLSPRPLFIIQGSNDQRMPVTEGQGLYETAREPKDIWVIQGADHGDAYDMAGPEYQKRILDFYAKWLN